MTLSEWLREFANSENISALVGLVGALTASVGTILTVSAKARSDREERSVALVFKATNDLRKDSRLVDVTNEFDRNRVIARWSASATTLLTFSQFIVGGVLASSFIQESLSKNSVGFLGVLVLLSSLIHQRYRPDLHASQAKHRMYKARKLIRSVEDDLFSISNGMSDAPTIFAVRDKASAGLSELEDIEIEGASSILIQTVATSNSGSTAA